MSRVITIYPYYEKAFEDNKAGTLFLKWNWAAFIFSYGWLAYRKAYKPFFLIASCELILNTTVFYLVETVMDASLLLRVHIFEFFFYLGMHSFLGLYGTSIYGMSWVKNPVPHVQNESFLSYFGLTFLLVVMQLLLLVGVGYLFLEG
jgi:hypothetical protein